MFPHSIFTTIEIYFLLLNCNGRVETDITENNVEAESDVPFASLLVPGKMSIAYQALIASYHFDVITT